MNGEIQISNDPPLPSSLLPLSLKDFELGEAGSAQTTTVRCTCSVPVREMVVNYLVRLLCTLAEPLQRKGLAHRILHLIRSFCHPLMWGNLSVKCAFFEKVFVPTDLNEFLISNLASILRVMGVVCGGKTVTWWVSNLHHFQPLVEKCFSLDQPILFEALSLFIQNLSSLCATLETPTPPISSLMSTFEHAINDSLVASRSILSWVGVIEAMAERNPNLLDKFTVNLAKLVSECAVVSFD